jgi:predicted RNase H-like HicB family nuclease
MTDKALRLTVEERIALHARADFFIRIGYDHDAEQYVVGFEDRGRPDCGIVGARGKTLERALKNAEKRIGL